jgi:molecular chaperone HtpG
LIVRFKSLLGERVSAVRVSTRLSASPARLVDPEGAPDQSVQRVYQMMDKDFELPKKVLELNPKHPIIARLSALRPADPKFDLAAEQIFENALLVEGLHPDPVSMVGRIQELIARALGDVEES